MQDTEIQEHFARLTAQFEDCAALAAEGQRDGLSREEARKLFCELKDRTEFSGQSLALVKHYLDGQY